MPKQKIIIAWGWLKPGPDFNQDWRGWPVYRILPDPADDYEPVTILRGHVEAKGGTADV